MKRLIKFVIFAPLAIILIALSIANRTPVVLSLDPFSSDPAISLNIPLYWLIFGCLFIGVLAGGMVVWFKQGRFRKEARDQKFEVAKARHEIKKVKNENPAPGLSSKLLAAPKT